MTASMHEVQLEWTTEYPTYSTDTSTATCLVSLAAPDVQEAERAPVSVSVVLDRSGSMRGRKLELVKESVKFILKHLKQEDSFSIVAFGSEVRLSCAHSFRPSRTAPRTATRGFAAA